MCKKDKAEVPVFTLEVNGSQNFRYLTALQTATTPIDYMKEIFTPHTDNVFSLDKSPGQTPKARLVWSMFPSVNAGVDAKLTSTPVVINGRLKVDNSSTL